MDKAQKYYTKLTTVSFVEKNIVRKLKHSKFYFFFRLIPRLIK